MFWPQFKDLQFAHPLPPGYHLDILGTDEVPMLIALLRKWYPDIVVGAESCHLNPDFYTSFCSLRDQADADRDILPVVLKHQDSIVLFLSLERNLRAQIITARLGSIDPDHRGMKLAYLGPSILEAFGRGLDFGMAYYTATLKIPHQQRVAENMGFRLVGILPAFDQDMVRPGVVRRVFEAVYAKILVEDEQLEVPLMANLTENTQRLFKSLFPEYLASDRADDC